MPRSMSTCPKCALPLVPEDYGGVRVMRCSQCRGTLVPRYRVEILGHRPAKDEGALKDEARSEIGADTKERIRCPKCRMFMDKQPLAPRCCDITYDYCGKCSNLWLDGGELALVQLVFQHSARGREAKEFQHRMAELELSPERRERFEAAMENLPDESVDREALGRNKLLIDLLSSIIWR